MRGKNISLRVAEKEDAALLAQWFNDSDFSGDFQHFPIQTPVSHLEKRIVEHALYSAEWVDMIISNSDGEEVGWIAHYTASPNFGWTEIGVAICPEHRRRGYASEAVTILTDYLFLSREVNRVQGVADTDNGASIRVFERAGYTREGTLRKSLWDRDGKWGDGTLLSILREDWDHAKILNR